MAQVSMDIDKTVDANIKDLLNDHSTCRVCEEPLNDQNTYILSCFHVCCQRCFEDTKKLLEEQPEVKCVLCHKVIIVSEVSKKTDVQLQIDSYTYEELEEQIDLHAKAILKNEKLVEAAQDSVKETMDVIVAKKEEKRILIDVKIKSDLDKAIKDAQELCFTEHLQQWLKDPQYAEPLQKVLEELRTSIPGHADDVLMKKPKYQQKQKQMEDVIKQKLEQDNDYTLKLKEYVDQYFLRHCVLREEVEKSYEEEEKKQELALDHNKHVLAFRLNLLDLTKRKHALLVSRAEQLSATEHKKAKKDL